jgi:hypothetical protein
MKHKTYVIISREAENVLGNLHYAFVIKILQIRYRWKCWPEKLNKEKKKHSNWKGRR